MLQVKDIKKSFGDNTGKRVFAAIGTATTAGVVSRTTKVNAATGALSQAGKIAVAANHHYHAELSEE